MPVVVVSGLDDVVEQGGQTGVVAAPAGEKDVGQACGVAVLGGLGPEVAKERGRGGPGAGAKSLL